MKDKTILLFDDDVNILEVCTIILENYGYTVATSETSHDIIEKVTEIRPDVILMDNWIPEIGGIKATQLVKQHPEFKHIPVIYVSANNDIHLLAEEAGADSYLEKPFNLDDLESAVNTMLMDSKDRV
ncbi:MULTISPECIES: response regulator [Sphingobacterium]|jgi:CheY-like chemotaxis protein|uniref:response regulator n=1 Tax=Sphingobacterium TaxID=28453 RepID=UPI0004E5F22F|nr:MULTISPECIES: response regulator [Sphingobacterium]CDT06298.1 Response regulator [Sphingobacterium sp. PM2-P1-29]SJN51741.1 Response regulators consisting of a CheY-like receiver domain and a HTH DNA-binding domain [Sphingobacterium faecium PCAi_F2.5]HCU45960.1 response regulator [Sphingobacterium sp.]UPZ35074.1 response regulator [Sphingobacterium sp. PCS056]UXD70638.1 response regulator [Sphingobacterium faecium]